MYRWVRSVSFAAACAVFAVSGASHVNACAFHGYNPDPTIVDIIMGSDHIILARPDPQNPGQYAAVSALEGSLELVDLSMTVDPVTRVRLAEDPSRTALIARDGAYGPWIKLAVLDERYRDVVTKIVARKADWTLGGDEDRYQHFANLLSSPNPDIYLLALAELDRANYAVLRNLRFPKLPNLAGELAEGDPFLRPIRVLLAGLSGDRSFAPTLSADMNKAAKNDVVYLGAYATALIELGGTEAVSYVQEHLLAPGRLPLEMNEKLIEAFAIHSQSGPKPVKAKIAATVAEMLAASPELAGAVARQYGIRSDWSMYEALSLAAAERPPTTVNELFAINQYIGIARSEKSVSK